MFARRLALVLTSAVLLLGPTGPQAVTSVYHDRTAWAAQAGAVGAETYEAFAWNNVGGDLLVLGGSVWLGPLVYRVPTGSALNGVGAAVTYDAPYLSGNYLQWQDQSAGPTTLKIDLPMPVTSIGFDFGQFYGTPLPFSVTLSNGDEFDLATSSGAYRFVGFISDRLFTSLTLTAPVFPLIDNLAWGLAHTTGAAPGSVRLTLNPGGPGHVLIIPYFSTQAGNATLINIVNSDEVRGKAVKVRFRGASNADALFDFQVFLPPGDVWSANVSQGPNGVPRLVTADTSCTLPASLAADFATDRLNTVDLSGDALASETREGYIEILTMADIETSAEATSLGHAIQHGQGGAPPCTASVLTSLTPGDLRLLKPTTGLAANWVIINVPNTTTWSGEAIAFEARSQGLAAEGRNVYWPQTATPLSRVQIETSTADPLLYGRTIEGREQDLPDLSTPYTTSAATPIAQVTTLSDALTTTTLAAEYLSDPTIRASTDWIISQPTRRYYAAVDYTRADPGEGLITNYNQFGLAGADYYRSMYTNDEQLIPGNIDTAPGNMAMGNPANGCAAWQAAVVRWTWLYFWNREDAAPRWSPPIMTPPPMGPSLCGAVSVLGINSPASPVDAVVSRINVTPPGPAEWCCYYPNVPLIDGWGRLFISNLLSYDPAGANLGLPMLATQFVKAINPAVAPGVSGTFGAAWKARMVKPGFFYAP
jgi:hypothetical protein